MSRHHCTETNCPYLGQASANGCGCHKTDEQILREQNAELLDALRALMPANLGPLPATMPDSATLPLDVTFGELRAARAAIAKATTVGAVL